VDSGGTTWGVQQQQGSTSRASVADRYSIPVPSLNNGSFSNLFNLWILCLWMRPKREDKMEWMRNENQIWLWIWLGIMNGGNEFHE
jgi:hypothetical protein